MPILSGRHGVWAVLIFSRAAVRFSRSLWRFMSCDVLCCVTRAIQNKAFYANHSALLVASSAEIERASFVATARPSCVLTPCREMGGTGVILVCARCHYLYTLLESRIRPILRRMFQSLGCCVFHFSVIPRYFVSLSLVIIWMDR